MLTLKSWPVLIVVLLLATAVLAAVTITYLTNSTVTLSTIEAPVRYEAGTETSNRYVSGWSLSSNETYFSATVKGVPEVNLTVDSLFKITNYDTDVHTVTLTLSGGAVSDPNITTLKIHIKDDSSEAHVATWDMTSSASVTLTAMPASETYRAIVYVTLASGAGNNNIAETMSVALSVT